MPAACSMCCYNWQGRLLGPDLSGVSSIMVCIKAGRQWWATHHHHFCWRQGNEPLLGAHCPILAFACAQYRQFQLRNLKNNNYNHHHPSCSLRQQHFVLLRQERTQEVRKELPELSFSTVASLGRCRKWKLGITECEHKPARELSNSCSSSHQLFVSYR